MAFDRQAYNLYAVGGSVNCMAVKIFYIIFIGVLLATFIGVGIATFYVGPRAPAYTSSPKPLTPDTATESAHQADLQQQKLDQQNTTYQALLNNYRRNVSILATVASLVLLALSLVVLRSMALLPDGVLLGGILTLLYGVGMGFGASDLRYRFAVVTVGLLVALGLGYIKFVIPEKKL
jgi:hypothetical protein